MLFFLSTLKELGWTVVWPGLFAGLLAVLPSLIFWLMRRRYLAGDPKAPGLVIAAFGTELFALLFAVDLAVALGLVEAWTLSSCFKTPNLFCEGPAEVEFLYRVAAWVMAVFGTPLLALVAMEWERESVKFTLQERALDTQRQKPRVEVDGWWIKGTLLRWTLSAFHLWFIVSVPKLKLFLPFLPK
jgi:hypothetical protein